MPGKSNLPVWQYTARDQFGEKVSGLIEAESETALAEKMSRLGYVLTSSRRQVSFFLFQEVFGSRKVHPRQIMNFYYQLYTLLNAGVNLRLALRDLAGQAEEKHFKEAIEGLKRAVEGGESLSSAMAHYPQFFSPLAVNMIRAGEASGKLEDILQRLARFAEGEEDIRSKVKAALTYPAILVVVALFIVSFLFVSVLPKFVAVFAKGGIPLPLPTAILIAIATVIRQNLLFILITLFILAVFFDRYRRTAAGKIRLDRIKLNLPVFGPLIRKMAISRFAHTLATLLSSGVPVGQSLIISERVVENEVLAQVIRNVATSVQKGGSLSEPLKVSGEFPPMVVRMVNIGEESGSLEESLDKISEFYDRDVPYAITEIAAILEPTIILAMAGMVALIAVSVLLPMVNMFKLI